VLATLREVTVDDRVEGKRLTRIDDLVDVERVIYGRAARWIAGENQGVAETGVLNDTLGAAPKSNTRKLKFVGENWEPVTVRL
jgi:hypothetical protein